MRSEFPLFSVKLSKTRSQVWRTVWWQTLRITLSWQISRRRNLLQLLDHVWQISLKKTRCKRTKGCGYQKWHVEGRRLRGGGGFRTRCMEENGERHDKHIQIIDLLEGIVLETGARLIKWKVILTHRGKLFANTHHSKLQMVQRILDIQQRCKACSWLLSQIGRIVFDSTRPGRFCSVHE